jgi:putative transcriptional regulator
LRYRLELERISPIYGLAYPGFVSCPPVLPRLTGMDTLAGSLLVATPILFDPNFYRTVVLLMQHDEDGCVGVVLNRPTVEPVADHLPEWADLVGGGLVNFGGPVDPAVAIGLSLSPSGMSTGVPGLSIIDLSEAPDEHTSPVRIYSGYSGWGSGQLEGEIATGSWYVVQASPDDPFDGDEDQWRRVLRRQPGHLSIVSTFPDDVELN